MIDGYPFLKPLLVSALFALIVGFAGGLLTEIGPWYRALKVPSWKPPDWVFGPVWTTIFVLATISATLIWQVADPGQRRVLVIQFFANAALNILWSLLFFKLRRPDLALFEVPLLWLSILVLVIWTWPIHRGASIMLLPYLIWVGIASVLNLAIVRLNA